APARTSFGPRGFSLITARPRKSNNLVCAFLPPTAKERARRADARLPSRVGTRPASGTQRGERERTGVQGRDLQGCAAKRRGPVLPDRQSREDRGSLAVQLLPGGRRSLRGHAAQNRWGANHQTSVRVTHTREV